MREEPTGATPSAALFEVFYVESRDRVARQIAALTGDSTEASDHVQEAYIRAWARWSRVSLLDDPEGWVRRVAHNLAVSRFRRARRMLLHADPPTSSQQWDDGQLDLLAALAKLPRPQRESLVLFHMVGLTVAEVADELGAPDGTVKSWLSRGRARLGELLHDEQEQA